MAELLLRHGADPNLWKGNGGNASQPPLLEAVSGRSPDLRIIRLLLDHGADVNAKSYMKCGALATLERDEGGLAPAVALLEAGASPIDPCIEEEGRTMYHYAVDYESPDLIKALSRTRLDVNGPDLYGVTPLELAVFRGRPNIVKAVLDAGASAGGSLLAGLVPGMRKAPRTGRAPLVFQAVKDAEDPDVLRLLIEARADMNAPDEGSGRRSPLQQAALMGSLEKARLLVKAGAKLEQRDGDGMTALHYAVQGGDKNVVKLLMDSGARPNAKAKDGLTPLDLAAKSPDPAGITAILKGGR
jgi:ankyrin repeat protein